MVNIALIGPGRMGVNYAKVIQQNPLAKLVAVCGNTPENTNKNASFLNVPLYFNNEWDKMLDEHPEISTVIVSTSEWAHLAPFLAAVKRKKNIIMEKPVAVNPLEYMMMDKLLKEDPSLLAMICYTCRFDPRYARIKKQLDQREIGDLGYIYCRRNADIKTAARVEGKIAMPYWLLTHDIDLMSWYTGSEVKEVFAYDSGKSEKGNFIIANLFFQDGTKGVIENVWFGEAVSGQDSTRIDLEGTKGKLELKYWAPSITQHTAAGTVEFDEWDMQEIYGKFVGSTPNMINHFIDVIANGVAPAVSFAQGISAVKVCEAIRLSILSGKVEKV